MTRPLYHGAAEEPGSRPTAAHAGLWFDKFCDTWRIDRGAWTMKGRRKEDNPKLRWINGVTNGRVGTAGEIEEHAMRLMRLVETRGGRAEVLTTESRFVTGLGRSHPVENGFAWHPTLGTPYLPGSSIKGLVRSWANADAEPPPDPQVRARLLGKPASAGGICFLDAVPTAPVQLEADVMTPHYAGWSKEEPPGDWRSPTPIPFLVTAAQTSFLFGIVPCCAVADGDLDTVSGWLRSALAWLGSGAKTAVGYGRFGPDDEQTLQWRQRLSDDDRRRREKQAREEAAKSPEGRWRLEIEGRSEADVLELVRVHLEKDPLPDPVERRAFANAVFSLRKDWVEAWHRGDKQDPRTNTGSKKLKERARLLRDTAAKIDRLQPFPPDR